MNKFDESDRLEEARAARKRSLIGGFVITQKSRYDKGVKLYLQDSRISPRRWTKYLSNARKFETREGALQVCKNFAYNDVRVERVTR